MGSEFDDLFAEFNELMDDFEEEEASKGKQPEEKQEPDKTQEPIANNEPEEVYESAKIEEPPEKEDKCRKKEKKDKKEKEPKEKKELPVPQIIKSDDILGDLGALGFRIFICIGVAMLDSIESAFATMSYASGRNFKWILLVTFLYIPISITSILFGYSPCIAWQDAVITFFVAIALWAINGINDQTIKSAVTRIKSAQGRVQEVGGKLKHGK